MISGYMGYFCEYCLLFWPVLHGALERKIPPYFCSLPPHPSNILFLIMNHPPLGQCCNKSCSFGGSCQAFYAVDGASTYGKNLLPLKCLCGCFGMQHLTGAGSGGNPPDKRPTEVCILISSCILSFTTIFLAQPAWDLRGLHCIDSTSSGQCSSFSTRPRTTSAVSQHR